MIDIQNIKGIIRRRLFIFLVAAIPVFMIAAAVAFLLPPIFVSKSTILIESQQIPEEYVKATVSGYVEERLQTITQGILSRSNLMKIINDFNLYKEMREKYAIEIVLAKMRKDINLEIIRAGGSRQRGAAIAFTLAYEGKEPATIQKVCNVLTSLYLEENLKKREAQATRTTQFLEQELNAIKQQIDDYGSKISAFKQANIGVLPEYSQINRQALDQLSRDLDQNITRIRTLRERKTYLEGQLATVKASPVASAADGDTTAASNPEERLSALRLRLISLRSNLSDKHPDVIKLTREIAELETQLSGGAATQESRLTELRQKLISMKSQLGTNHPEVVRLSKEITDLSKEMERSRAGSSISSSVLTSPQNPAVRTLERSIDVIDLEIGNLLTEQNRIKDRMASYQQKVENAPLIEKEYSSLLTDYTNAKQKYNELMSKLLQARVAKGMEETQHGERFTIIEPANMPGAPEKPDRKKLLLMGLFLACGIGAGLGFVMETMDHSIKATNDLDEMGHIPVLSSIPLMETDDEMKRRRRKIILATAACIGTLCIALIAVHLLYMPLDILWMKIQRGLMISY